MRASDFVQTLYRQFPGRVPVVAAGNHQVGNVYPFVYETEAEGPRALVACYPKIDETGAEFVHVAHVSGLTAQVDVEEVRRRLAASAAEAGVELAFGRAPTVRDAQDWRGDLRPGPRFVREVQQTYGWRVPLSVGLTVPGGHLLPSVVSDLGGRPVGLVGCGWNEGAPPDLVQVYHVSAFHRRRGHGTFILDRLCELADVCGAQLFVHALPQYDDGDDTIPDEDLIRWYRGFGFDGAGSGLTRPWRS